MSKYALPQRIHAKSSQLLDESIQWSDAESPPAQSFHTSDAQPLQNSSITGTEKAKTPATVVSESTSSIFSKFIPDITILIARANSTNSTDITQEEATSLASTLSSIPSLKGISKEFNSPESIKQIIVKSKSTENSSGEPPTNPRGTNPPPPPNSLASSASSVQSLGDDGQASLVSSRNTARAKTYRAAGTASPPVKLFNDDDSTTDDESSQKSLSLSDDADLNGPYEYRREDVPPSHPGPVAFYAKQQRQNARDPAPALPGASRAATSTRAAAGAAGTRTMTTVPHDKSFMGEPFVRQFSPDTATASAAQDQTSRAGARGSSGAAGASRAPPIGNYRFTMPPPPPSPFPPSASEPQPPFTQPRYPYVDLTRGSHPGGGY